jgi:hypothetical protein
VQVAAFRPALSGDASLESSMATPVEDVSLRSDLDFTDRSTEFYGKAGVSVVGFNLFASGFQTSQDGTGRLTADFGDISAGTTVNSSFDMTLIQGGLTFNLVDIDVLRLALGVGADYFDAEIAVEDRVTSIMEDLDGAAPVPLVMLDGDVCIPGVPLELGFLVGGMSASYGDIDGLVLDGEALLTLTALDPVDLFAGYRYLSLDLDGVTDDQDFTTDLVLQGWFVGAGLRF